MVTSTSCSRASRSTSSTSSGLAKRASATVVERPWLASCSAALRQSPSRVPNESSATAVPSRTMRPLPISSGTPISGHVDADAVAARIAQCGRTVVDGDLRSRPYGPVRPRRPPPSRRSPAGSRDRRRRTTPAWVGPSAPTRPARSMREPHRQALDRHVMHDLVVGALQEGRIDRGERLVALRWPGRRRRSPRAARRCRRRRSARGTPCRTCRRRCPTASPP